jgi:hypothetical protein
VATGQTDIGVTTSGTVVFSSQTGDLSAPVVSSVSPASGAAGGGGSVLITGANLGSVTSVHFGLATSPSFTVDSDTSITAVAPNDGVDGGPVDVSVTTPTMASGNGPGDVYDYLAAPVFVNQGGWLQWAVGSSVSFTVTATGDPVPSFSVVGSLPNGIRFADNGNGTATFSGTPSATSVGRHNVVVTATGLNGATATDSVLLEVDPAAASTSPVLGINISPLPGAHRGSKYDRQLLVSGGRAPYVWKRSGLLPRGLTLSLSGVLSGTPSPNLPAGTYWISVTVRDSTRPIHERASMVLTLGLS